MTRQIRPRAGFSSAGSLRESLTGGVTSVTGLDHICSEGERVVRPVDSAFLYARYLKSEGRERPCCPRCDVRLVYDGAGYSCLGCDYTLKILPPHGPLPPPGMPDDLS
jgi:hypothetical protein